MKNQSLIKTLSLFTLFALLATPGFVFAQEEAAAEEKPITEEQAYTIPDGTPEEILQQVNVLNDFLRQPSESQGFTMERLKKMFEFHVEIADKALSKDPEKEQKTRAIELKFQALDMLARYPGNEDNEEPGEKFKAFAAEVAKMEDIGRIAERAKGIPYEVEMNKVFRSENFVENTRAFREKLVKFVEENPTANSGVLVVRFISGIAYYTPEKDLISYLKENRDILRPVLEKSEKTDNSPNLINFDRIVEEKIFYAEILGQEMKMEGLNLKDEKITIQSLRGKVVLIDFWATWCGPCIGEIPNMKKNYEKYKDRGFEIIGYSTDRDLEALIGFQEKEKLPWIILSRQKSIDAELEDIPKTYKVTGIPTMFLIDKEGKIISTKARGETLDKLLAEIFPEE